MLVLIFDKMWLKLKKTNENVEETNKNIAIAYLTMMQYRKNSEAYETLGDKEKRKKLTRLYANFVKTSSLSDEVTKHSFLTKHTFLNGIQGNLK